jgi:tripartite-type tricarboxylate transporter receptor subunit TctC
MRITRRLAGGLALAALALGLTLHPAAAEYPEKPITLIIPLGAGGSHDLNARVFTSILPEYLGQPVVVKLMPGASGQTGTAAAAEAPADGYTLLFSHNYFDQLQQHIVDLPYEPTEDFVTVARLNTAPLSVVVRSDAQWTSLEQMFAWAKEHPGELSFAHSGQWGAVMVPGAQLLQQAGVSASLTPYQGGGPALQALLAGDVDFTLAFPSVIEGQGDALRVLASAGEERLDPDVPTLRDLGYEEDIGVMHRIVLAPRGTPDDVLQTLRDAFAQLPENETYLNLMERLGEDPTTYMDGAAYEERRPQQSEAFQQLIESFKS